MIVDAFSLEMGTANIREISNFSSKIIILNCSEGVKVQALAEILMLIIVFFILTWSP